MLSAQGGGVAPPRLAPCSNAIHCVGRDDSARRFTGFRPGGISPPRRRVSFPTMGKKPKDRWGTAQNERAALIFAFPPSPPVTGVLSSGECRPPGAENLSGRCNSSRATGPWPGGKFRPSGFRECAWFVVANGGRGYSRRGGACPSRWRLKRRRGGTPGPPAYSAASPCKARPVAAPGRSGKSRRRRQNSEIPHIKLFDKKRKPNDPIRRGTI